MDPAVYGPGPVNGNLLTLQNDHRSEAVWNRREKWRLETHTFHLSFGEATITLEDVHHILGLRTTGRPLILHGYTSTPAQRVALVRDLLGLSPGNDDLGKDNLKI
ncbi:hypothetical protein DCAR_0520218 [Daucus carota subsp. sativus]|uniref:Aminotransferase-like plant mobile domain-containing protein n=1 Tax=Daucus carota subsp. sativus TaxID=79200 RepID=A0AAF0X5I4_DAUCS|nr:hypothetical protein DCAR_0520218 [Daucus carota subsp. sativus]